MRHTMKCMQTWKGMKMKFGRCSFIPCTLHGTCCSHARPVLRHKSRPHFCYWHNSTYIQYISYGQLRCAGLESFSYIWTKSTFFLATNKHTSWIHTICPDARAHKSAESTTLLTGHPLFSLSLSLSLSHSLSLQKQPAMSCMLYRLVKSFEPYLQNALFFCYSIYLFKASFSVICIFFNTSIPIYKYQNQALQITIRALNSSATKNLRKQSGVLKWLFRPEFFQNLHSQKNRIEFIAIQWRLLWNSRFFNYFFIFLPPKHWKLMRGKTVMS